MTTTTRVTQPVPTESLWQPYDGHGLYRERHGHTILGSEREASQTDGRHTTNVTRPSPFWNATYPNIDHGVSTNSQNTATTLSKFHSQQMLQRYLANRKFDGGQGDPSKSVPIDEFVQLLKQFQKTAGLSDQEVLYHLTPCVTGKAFTWWVNQQARIQSLAVFERELRSRFGRKASEPSDVVVEFFLRRQGKDEDLLDYIDEMEKLLTRCPGVFAEWKKIRTIVDNANEQDNRILVTRDFATVEELTQYASYLARNRPYKGVAKTREAEKRAERSRSNRRVDAMQAEGENASNHDSGESADETDEFDAVVNVLKTAWSNKFNRSGGKSVPKRTEKERDKPVNIRPKKGTEPTICANCGIWGHSSVSCDAPKTLHCYDCGQPGVVKSRCEFCKEKEDQSPKNGQANPN